MLFESKETLKPLSTAIEFQTIILAGFGNNLYPLTEENNLPKALLPIANEPLISYPLRWCEQAGLPSCLIVCHAEAYPKILAFVRSEYQGSLKISVESPGKITDSHGAADALRRLKHKIKTDVILLSCDTFLNVPFQEILDYHRAEDPSVTTIFYDTTSEKSVTIAKGEVEKSLVGIDLQHNRLLLVKDADDLNDEISLRMSLLWKFPRVTLSTTLQDSYIYIMKRWVIEYILRNERISSIKDDLIPVLVKMQYQSLLLEQEGIKQNKPSFIDFKDDNLKHRVQVNLYMVPKDKSCLRANNISAYSEFNRLVSKSAPEPRVSPSAEVSSKAAIGSDSIIGGNSKIDERTSVKRSIIGRSCVIGKNVKITNSIIMDYSSVDDGSRLEGCIICRGAKIGSKSNLKDCEIGAGFQVEVGTNAKNDQLVKMVEIIDA